MLFLAAPLAQGLLSTAIRTAGSRTLAPYITELVSLGAGRKTATTLAKQYVKTVNKANKTGSFPLIDKKTSQSFINALNNTQRSELQRKGLLASDEFTQTLSKARMLGTKTSPTVNVSPYSMNVTKQISSMPVGSSFAGNPYSRMMGSTYGHKIGAGGERIVIPRNFVPMSERASQSGKFLPVPVQTGVNPLQQQASRIALARQKEAMQRMNKPITQTVDTGWFGNIGARMGNSRTSGVVGGLASAGTLGLTGYSVAPMFMPSGEQPTQAGTMSTGRLLSQAPQQEQAPAMRFKEVLIPSSQSTAKEVLNAALLRAGLSLMKPTRPGQTPLTQALESASTVASSQTSYTSGEQALAAGKLALGEDAKISVFQRSDGTFGYQGTTADTSLIDNSFFGEQPEGDNVTKEQYDKAVATIKAQFPDATEQDIKDTLEANNIRYTGE